jgi:hypothetical protein
MGMRLVEESEKDVFMDKINAAESNKDFETREARLEAIYD